MPDINGRQQNSSGLIQKKRDNRMKVFNNGFILFQNTQFTHFTFFSFFL